MTKNTVVVKERRTLEPRVQAALDALRKPDLTADEMFSSRFNMQAVAKLAGVSWLWRWQTEKVGFSILGLGVVTFFISLFANIPSLQVSSVPLSGFAGAAGGLIGLVWAAVPLLFPIDRLPRGSAVYGEVYRQNFEAFTVWLKTRYGLEWDVVATGYSLQKLNRDLTEEGNGSLNFTTTDGGSYVLVKQGNEFYVKEQKEELVGEAPTSVGVLDMFVSSEEFHPVFVSWADTVNRIEALQKFSLSVEQRYVLDRALREAEESLTVFRAMRQLDADADDEKVTEVIAGISAEVDKVTGEVLAGLGSKLDISSVLVKGRTEDKVSGSLSLS